MIHVGETAKRLRESLGLTQVEMAARLCITNVYLSKIENDHSFPSSGILERYREAFGIDLYVVAWCWYGDVEKLPIALREPATALARAWEKRFQSLIKERKTSP